MTEAFILVVLQPRLTVQVDVEKFPSVQRLSQSVVVVQVCHLFVACLWVQAHDVPIVKLGD